MKKKVIVYGVITLLIGLYVFIQAPVLNPLYFDGAFFYCAVITIYILAAAVLKFSKITVEKPSQERPLNVVPKLNFPKKVIFIAAAPWVLLILCSIASSVLFNVSAFRDQLGEPETRVFESDMQAVDTRQIPIVDVELAAKLADKKLGERPALGSQVVLGEPTIQMVDGKLVWVVPLQHSGFFKWITNLDGTPGYIVVSATNMTDVQYVEGHKIKYQPSAFLLQNLHRYLRFHSALFTGITDYSFELNDDGVPYWVATTYRNRRFFSLPEATGVILLNATTGEATQYAIDDVPEWVDRVQPEDFVTTQINNKGEYVHGIFNFANKDKYRTSEGHIIVYNEGKCYLFTGLTSVGGDDSAIGFIMVDMVTKESHLYQMAGATEKAAQQSAEGKVQHLAYKASFPLIINVEGQPTYFMTLKDNAGLVKQYAMVNVSDYSVVGVGETISATVKNYEQTLRNSSGSASFDNTAEKEELTGKVLRIASEFDGSSTVYKIILEEHANMIFLVPADLSNELALTREGDGVSIEYAKGEEEGGIYTALSFDNTEFRQS
ncbi:hypothetical protein [Zongyangia hominis]|uniref:Cell shape-determining protein n=1 Tax=Zongyangia hominis TaxID=2763677 RepID=A0A926IAN4_9FIRM|nr:hypothetical protein [Zongyangia hominis]MBC8569282.1 hypothetical protein [Zongyangia hominis]